MIHDSAVLLCSIIAVMQVYGSKTHGWGESGSNLVNALNHTSVTESRLSGLEETQALIRIEIEANKTNSTVWTLSNGIVSANLTNGTYMNSTDGSYRSLMMVTTCPIGRTGSNEF